MTRSSNLVRFVPLTPPALRALDVDSLTSDDVERQHYGVFLVSGTTRRITPIDLGPVRQIDDAVSAYRAIQQRQAAPESFKLDEPELSAAGNGCAGWCSTRWPPN